MTREVSADHNYLCCGKPWGGPHAADCDTESAKSARAREDGKPCPAIAAGWCQAPWQCAQPCTGRGGRSW